MSADKPNKPKPTPPGQHPNSRKNLIPFKPGPDERRGVGVTPVISDIKRFMKERLVEKPDGPEGPTRLTKLIDKVFALAEEGNLKALEIALAYGYGKPTQGLELTGSAGGPIMTHDFSGLTNDQLKERIEQLKLIDERSDESQE